MTTMRPGILSAGVVLVRRSEEGWRYLLVRCYRYWDFPKGELEPAEDPLVAARREVMEETGLVDLEFAWGLEFHQTEPYRAGKRARYYLARCERGKVVLGVSPELGRPENQEYRWVSRAEAERLLTERVRKALDWAARRIEPGVGNLFQGLTPPATGERFDELLRCGCVQVERILSSADPESERYDQRQDEWVLLLEGRASLDLAGRVHDMGPGDWLFIPAHTPHRVIATRPEPHCVWLAVHIHPSPEDLSEAGA